GHPFFRRYGVNLPSSLTRNHPIALELSLQPTSVGLRYGRRWHPEHGFSWPRELNRIVLGRPQTAPLLGPKTCEVERGNSSAAPGLSQGVLYSDLIVHQR